jgi:hypothetical protein
VRRITVSALTILPAWQRSVKGQLLAELHCTGRKDHLLIWRISDERSAPIGCGLPNAWPDEKIFFAGMAVFGLLSRFI